MGLNDNFKPVRGQILLMKPLPCVEDAYSMIQQEERQMDISHFMYNDESSTALMSGRDNTQTSHVQEKCFKLHGFLANHKTKGKPQGNTSQKKNNSGYGGHMAHQVTTSSPNPINHASTHANDDQSSSTQVNIAKTSLQQSDHHSSLLIR
ncbi:hypothetical protein BUALT_Bualt04G0090800 [Buddleja alternifolia]|uniref:Period n=1 Tax=Buddleja alternifolia TaxID=168488 RepID=A0AAV6XY87_9LAMI|nr:hypothetical protein BUALT_Bualt04G0090800 [Buddleja alternifolia]